MILMLGGSCSEEKRIPRFEVWDIWTSGYCYPEGPICSRYGRCLGYLGEYQSMMLVHYKKVNYGFRSQTFIFKGVKY